MSHFAGRIQASSRVASSGLRRRQSFSHTDNQSGVPESTASAKAGATAASAVQAASLSHAAASVAPSHPIRKQFRPAPESVGGGAAEEVRATALPAPRKNVGAGLRIANTAADRQPWRSGRQEIPAAALPRPAQADAPGQDEEQCVSSRGLQRAQLVEKYRAGAAARRQAHTQATMERTASIAAVLQHASSLQAPSKGHHSSSVRKQGAAGSNSFKSASMKQLPANTKLKAAPQAAAERQTSKAAIL